MTTKNDTMLVHRLNGAYVDGTWIAYKDMPKEIREFLLYHMENTEMLIVGGIQYVPVWSHETVKMTSKHYDIETWVHGDGIPRFNN